MREMECPDHIDTSELTRDDFDELVGGEFDFYGVDGNCFKLDDQVYEALEDADNGYRSYLACVEVRDAKDKLFFRMPVARVTLEHEVNRDDVYYSEECYTLIDLHNGHCWLRFGTDATQDRFYPMFIFDYTPKGPEHP